MEEGRTLVKIVAAVEVTKIAVMTTVVLGDGDDGGRRAEGRTSRSDGGSGGGGEDSGGGCDEGKDDKKGRKIHICTYEHIHTYTYTCI
jgi:hypothetical protein